MSKNIVICCDGTNNKFSERNSNIVRIAQLSLHIADTQIVYYDPGVGTLNLPTDSNAKILYSKLLGEGFGVGLHLDIEDAYRYLMDNYQPEDKVFLFGFSRGAYTVRALAGLLHKFGLLRKGSLNLVPYVSQMYHKYNKIKGIQTIASQFKASFCVECKPHFIGVFDTVEALGKFYKKKIFTDASLNQDVKYAYHAISIDESRRPFKPFLWNEETKNPNQLIEQVWFAGDHSDIGGGHIENDLSDITLQWMLSKAELAGIMLKKNWQNTLLPSSYGPIHDLYNFFWKIAGFFHDCNLEKMQRIIPENSKIHISVKERIEQINYNPPFSSKVQFVD